MLANRLHILVVDDLSDVAESTAEVLGLWGYDATACESGALALACASACPPAAVLLDLVMPLMDGFRFARAFHELPGCAAVPLVAISGYWSPAYTELAEEAGIGHYLVKPADPDELKALLASVTNPRRAIWPSDWDEVESPIAMPSRSGGYGARRGSKIARGFAPRILAD